MKELNTVPASTAQDWFIAYTLPRHEKAIAERLSLERVPCYVPLYSETRTWRQRKVKVELPLFPCYVFVKMFLENKGRMLSSPGVVRLLTNGGSAVVFPDEEMNALKSSLERWSARPYPSHSSGKTIRLKSGPFAGLDGSIVRRDGKRKLVVRLNAINSSILLNIDVGDAELSI